MNNAQAPFSFSAVFSLAAWKKNTMKFLIRNSACHRPGVPSVPAIHRRLGLPGLLLATAFAASAMPPTPAPPQKQGITITHATLHVGNGQVLPNAQISFENGVITDVAAGRLPLVKANHRIIDAKGAQVYPGFILPVTDLGLREVDALKATLDANEVGQLNPNVRSIVAYNAESERIPTMKFNGILLAQTTPQGGLVSGTSSVVQLDAWNWEDAAVKMDDAVHVHWPARARLQFDIGTFMASVKKDKQFAKKTRQIKTLFQDAKSWWKNPPANLTNQKLASLSPVFDGHRKLFIHASDPKCIVEAVQFFKELGADNALANNLVLVTGAAAMPVVDFLKQQAVPVIVDSVHDLPHQKDATIDEKYALPAYLKQHGITTGLAYQAGMSASARNLAFTAGTAAAYGLGDEQAIKMITLDNAKILGIANKYGSLEKGKSATLFISSGNALDMQGNQISHAFIDGREIDLKGKQQQLYRKYGKKLGIIR
jgi:imidazolonepropionase-like amidohydrolase